MQIKAFLLLFFTSLFSLQVLVAQDGDVAKIASEYLSLYTSMQFDEIQKFYTEDSIFEDPTMSIFNENGHYETPKGPRNIADFLTKGFNNISDVHFEIKSQYTSGIVAYHQGILHFKSSIGTTKEGNPFRFELPLAIILSIKNGKIIRHQDIADYETWNQQYLSQSRISK